jgi:hypothetical protein
MSKAAEFIADKLKAYGLQPAAGVNQYIRQRRSFCEVVGSPTLTFGNKSKGLISSSDAGNQIVIAGLSRAVTSEIDLNDEAASATNASADWRC